MGSEPDLSRPLGVVVRVLGVVTLLGPDGRPVPLTAAELRVLSVLTASGDDGATTEQLERAVWEAAPPPSARQSLHNHVHRLRAKLVGPRLVLSGDRYRLEPVPSTDAAVFTSLVAEAADGVRDGAAEDAVHLLREARSWWRGEPYTGVDSAPAVLAARTDLLRTATAADDLLVRALLESGQTPAAAAELERLLARDPAHEARWELLIESLLRAGRRGEALEAVVRAREQVVTAFGVEPGQRLRALHQLLLHSAAAPSPLALELPLVGRDAVVAGVLASLHRGGTVVVSGEGGIGKSAVLRAVAQRWPGSVVTVDCGGSPFAALGPVAALLDALAPQLAQTGLPLSLAQISARLHGGSPAGHGWPGTLERRATEVVVAGLQSDPTTLLLLDDVDQAGPTSRAILRAAVEAVLLPVVLAVRDTDGALPLRPGHAEVALTGLDAEGAAELASLVLQTPVSARFGSWLEQYSGGHPLFMLALLDDLLARGLLTTGAQNPRPPSTPPVPAHLRDALQQRIAGLGSRSRRAVDVVAVVGQPVRPDQLAELLRPEDLQPALEDGILQRDGDGAVRFPHELLRTVAYDYVPAGRRAELHHRIAALELSWAHRAGHLLAAADLDPDAAVAAAAQAGADAVAGHAYAEGADWFDRALSVGRGRMGDLAALQLQVDAADARRLAGLPGHAEPLLDAAERAVEIGGTALRRRAVLAALRLGGGVEAGEAQRRAAALADRVLADEDDPAWWARIAAANSLVHSIAGTPRTCRELLQAAWSAAGERDDVLVDVLPYAYMALGHPDDLLERTRAATRLAEAARAMDDPVAEFEAGHLAFSVALQCADGEGARRAHQAMARLTDRVADAGRRWSLAYQEAALAAMAGDEERAEALAGVALEVGNGVAPKRAFGAYAGQLFELRRRQGRLSELAGLVLQLVQDQPEIPGWAAAGSLAVADVDPVRSRELFDVAAADDLRGLPRDFAWLAAVMTLGRTAVVLRDAERAARIEPVLLPYAELACWEGTCCWGPVAEVLAGLAGVRGESERARELDERAAARWASLAAAGAAG